jgi:ectoine hydroxylase-related dioxygenase (phytanoyl-CoA dioxygenase family)
MDTSATNSRAQQVTAQQADTDWGALTPAQRIRSIELEGFVVLPDLLSAQQLVAIRDELDRLPTKAVDYSPHQRGYADVQSTASPVTIETIAHPEILGFLQSLFGDELICTSCTFTVADPGHPGVVLHTDAQPYGSRIFGMQASSPVLARVLYYLDDLTPECSPFKVIPRSHLCLHRDANPYHRYLSHPDERMVTCKAGSAAIINQKVFHGNYPNYSDNSRRMLAIAYRPAWAGPMDDIDERDSAQVAGLPTHIQPYFKSLNTRHIEFDLPNRPDGMAVDAAGLSPQRWGERP